MVYTFDGLSYGYIYVRVYDMPKARLGLMDDGRERGGWVSIVYGMDKLFT